MNKNNLTIEKFSEKYKDKGGFVKLNELIKELKTQDQIAQHFSVTRYTIRSWSKAFFGKIYDPRLGRRGMHIEAILDFMKTHSKEESEQTFKNTNRDYYNEALFLAEKQELWSETTKSPTPTESLPCTQFSQAENHVEPLEENNLTNL